MTAKLRTWGLALFLSAGLAGCMMPSYQLPAGFSSSYHRQLYGMEPSVNDSPDLGLAAVESHRGIFYSTSVYNDPKPAEVAKEKAMEPMFLGSDPISPEKPVRRINYDTN